MDFARTGHFVFESFSYGLLHGISVVSFLLRIMQRKEQIFLPDTTINAYAECSDLFYRSTKILLKIFATLLVSTVTTERILSVLKLLKTYLHSTMSET